MIKYLFYLYFLALAFSISSCKVSSTSLQTDLSTLINDSNAFDNSFTGCLVYDPEKEETVLSYNSGKYFNAASNTKLFTFYAGLKILGDSIPALQYAIHGDSLIIKGTGDPSFLHPELNSNTSVFKLLSDSSKNIFYVKSEYPQQRFGPGWAWDDYNDYYSTEKAAFPIYGNTVIISFNDESEKPLIYPDFFSNLLSPTTTTSKVSGSPTVYREEFRNNFIYKSELDPVDTVPFSRIVPYLYSQELFVELLADTLNKKIKTLPYFPSQFLNKTIYSIHSDSLYKKMLQESDNFIAEQLLLLCSFKFSDTLDSKIAIDYVKQYHFEGIGKEIQWADGSGLSRYNLFTPQSIVNLLLKISNIVPKERLFSLFPAGVGSGNLQEYNKTEKPFIFAKTGTLSNNFNLSGYLVTKSGKTLVFSFMNNNYIIAGSKIKHEMNNILRNIYENY